MACGALSLVLPAAPSAWAQSADFDDAEAQLQVRQAASAASAGARKVDALRKELESERQRVVQNDSERDLNQAALQVLERELKTAEAKQRELDAALKAAQDARTRGLALRQQGPGTPGPPAASVTPTLEDQERAKAEAAQKQREEQAAVALRQQIAKAAAEQKLREEQAAIAAREQIAKAAAEQKLRDEQAAARALQERQARAAAEQKLREEQAAVRALQEQQAKAAAEQKVREEQAARALQEQLARVAAAQRQLDEQARRAAEEERKAAALKRAADDEARRKAEAEARQKAEADTQKTGEATEVALALPPAERRQIQEALTALGFDTAGADGAFGAKTREMIGRWQGRKGRPSTTYLDRAQIAALLSEAAAPLARLEEERRKKETAVPPTMPAAATTTVPPEITWALGRWTGTIVGCCNDSTTRNLQVSWTPGAVQCGWSVSNKPPVDATSGCAVSATEVRLTTSANSAVVLQRAGAGLAGTFTLKSGKSYSISLAREGMVPRQPDEQVALAQRQAEQRKIDEAKKPGAAPNVASAAPAGPSSWTAVVRLIRERSANNCDENLPRFRLVFDGGSLDMSANDVKVLTAKVAGDGSIKERFRLLNGGRLEVSGNVRSRDLEVARWDQLCRWKLVPG